MTTTKFFISKIQKSPRKVVESINCGTNINQVKIAVESLTDAKVIAIREATTEETAIINTGWNVAF